LTGGLVGGGIYQWLIRRYLPAVRAAKTRRLH